MAIYARYVLQTAFDRTDSCTVQSLSEKWLSPAFRSKTQDARTLRRYKGRWAEERLFAWLQWFRRLVTHYEYHAENFLGMVRLGCMRIMLRHL
jgi:transposase